VNSEKKCSASLRQPTALLTIRHSPFAIRYSPFAKAEAPMRAAIIAIATLIATGTAHAGTLDAYNDPLVFGMTRAQVERVVAAPLVYLSGARGSERFLVERPATVPGFYPVDTSIVLQFRRGRLTGWRRDWQMRAYWF
jgi:hypothetical protein